MDEIDDLIDSYDGSNRHRQEIIRKAVALGAERHEIVDALDEIDEDNGHIAQCPECGYEMRNCLCIQFADPGGNSALRAASASNPRNLPCPECGEPDRLTPADRDLGYRCDQCADRAERGGY